MPEVHVSVATVAEHAELNQCYRRWGYRGGIAAADIVYVASLDGQPVGLVRRTHEAGVEMLRGMQIAPEHQRRGFGTRLLHAFVDDLPPVDCYCIPFSHLTRFYSLGGFAVIDESRAGDFLRTRIAHYRAEGHKVILMRRIARGDPDRAS